MAVVLDEPEAEVCSALLDEADVVLISAVTVTEALIVSAGRDVSEQMADLIDGLAVQVVGVDETAARRVGQVYARWGRGFHPASLNFGDCFAYDIAKTHACPLLYVGDDFSKTDVRSALAI